MTELLSKSRSRFSLIRYLNWFVSGHSFYRGGFLRCLGLNPGLTKGRQLVSIWIEITSFSQRTTKITQHRWCHLQYVYKLLSHWGRVTHICVIKLTIIGSDNGLARERRQAIIWTDVGLLLIGPLGTHFSEILIEILTFLFKKMRLKVSSAKRWPFCLGLNVLTCLFDSSQHGDINISIQIWFDCRQLIHQSLGIPTFIYDPTVPSTN